MSLVFRVSHSERLLRSVDDLPGVIGCGNPKGPPTVYVDPSWLPPPELVAEAERIAKAGGHGAIGEPRTVTKPDQFPGHCIDLDDAVDACEGPAELRALLAIVVSAIPATMGKYVPCLAFEEIAATATFAAEARDKILARLREVSQ